MRKLVFFTVVIMTALAGCTKPESDEELLGLNNNLSIDEMAYVSTAKAEIFAEDDFPQVLCHQEEYDFIAGQHIDAGDIIVGNDNNNLYIKITSTDGFQNAQENVKIWFGTTIFSSRPSAGSFPYKYTVEEGENTLCLSFTLSELGLKCDADLFYIAIHGDVLASEGEEEPAGQTAWGGNEPGDGSAWWFYIAYEPKCCDPDDECDIYASVKVTDVKCYGASTGSINLTVTGGTPELAFSWSNGATTEDLINVPAGTYSVTVTDADQCVAVVEDILVLQPASGVSATSVVTQISKAGECDGAIDITPAGGTSPYIYLWNNGATTQDLSYLCPGSYSVTITDANECNFVLQEILIENPEKEKSDPVVAFAQKSFIPSSYCFSSLDLDGNGFPDFNDWGWTNGPVPLTFDSWYRLYIGADGCNTANAKEVGRVYISYKDNLTTIKFEAWEGYTLDETRLYIGEDKLPKDTYGNFTVDPEFYPHVHENIGGISVDTYTIDGTLEGNIYVVLYALINLPEAD